jgi:hypothetical protein
VSAKKALYSKNKVLNQAMMAKVEAEDKKTVDLAEKLCEAKSSGKKLDSTWVVSDDEEASDEQYKTAGSVSRKQRRLQRLKQENRAHDETTDEESKEDESED